MRAWSISYVMVYHSGCSVYVMSLMATGSVAFPLHYNAFVSSSSTEGQGEKNPTYSGALLLSMSARGRPSVMNI